MTNKIQLVLIVLLIPAGIVFWFLTQNNLTVEEVLTAETQVLRIDEVPIQVEIVSTPEDLQKGLSGRKGLQDATGMLFVFEESDYHGIWMKDMNFPIDVIWIGEDHTVVSVNENVSPDSFPKTFRPSRPVKYVLETNVHFADIMSIQEGDPVELPRELVEKP